MQHLETREWSTKNANDIQACIIAETNLLRDSVALVRDQAIIINKHLDEIKGSQETRTLLEKVLEASNRLDIQFQKVERLVTQNRPDQTQIVSLLNNAFDVLAEYNQRKTYADLVSWLFTNV
jgi:hypothetical protein